MPTLYIAINSERAKKGAAEVQQALQGIAAQAKKTDSALQGKTLAEPLKATSQAASTTTSKLAATNRQLEILEAHARRESLNGKKSPFRQQVESFGAMGQNMLTFSMAMNSLGEVADATSFIIGEKFAGSMQKALSTAGSFMEVGSAFGVWGTGIGMALGLVVGGLRSYIESTQAAKEASKDFRDRMQEVRDSASLLRQEFSLFGTVSMGRIVSEVEALRKEEAELEKLRDSKTMGIKRGLSEEEQKRLDEVRKNLETLAQLSFENLTAELDASIKKGTQLTEGFESERKYKGLTELRREALDTKKRVEDLTTQAEDLKESFLDLTHNGDKTTLSLFRIGFISAQAALNTRAMADATDKAAAAEKALNDELAKGRPTPKTPEEEKRDKEEAARRAAEAAEEETRALEAEIKTAKELGAEFIKNEAALDQMLADHGMQREIAQGWMSHGPGEDAHDGVIRLAEGARRASLDFYDLDEAMAGVEESKIGVKVQQNLEALDLELDKRRALLGAQQQGAQALKIEEQVQARILAAKLAGAPLNDEEIAAYRQKYTELAKLDEQQKKVAASQKEMEDAAKATTSLFKTLQEQSEQMVAQMASSAIMSTIDSIAGMLADGIVEGKIAWGDFFKQLQKDLLKLAIQMAVFKGISMLLGGGGAAGAAFSAVQFIGGPRKASSLAGGVMGGMIGAGLHHGGGIAGEGPTTMRSADFFFGARRYHNGGVVGEVPAVLQEGEEVLTRSDPRHRKNGGGGRSVINNIDARTFVQAQDVGSFLRSERNISRLQERRMNRAYLEN
jgi:hypothetical protein